MRKLILLVAVPCVLVAATKQPTLFTRRDYPSANGFVAVADINNDGIPDAITFGKLGIGTLLGNGNGTFRAGITNFNPGGQVGDGDLIPVDLNGDGNVDLVLAQPGGIEVCLGNGDGTFQHAVAYGPAGSTYLASGDFNGDGLMDVALASNSGIYLYFGKSGGVFNAVLIPVTPSGSTTNRPIATADLNGDGKLDLVVSSASPNGFLVMFGKGDGTFQTPLLYSVSSSPSWVTVGDLNGDSHQDIVIVENNTLVYLNNGYGQFIRTTSIPSFGPQATIGKINPDDIPDLVASNGAVAFGLGHGKFATPVPHDVAQDTLFDVVVAPLSQTGGNDVLVGTFASTSVLLNEGNGALKDGVWTAVPGSGNCGAAADFNGDGKSDLAVPTTTGMTVLLGTGKGSAPYTTGPSFTASGVGCPITADLNGDGLADLLVGADSLGGVGAYLGNGDGTFRLAGVIPVGPAQNLVVGDFNHDGKVDFADSSGEMALGNGDGTFQAPVPILANPPVEGFVWIAAGDFNNDGWTDLFATQSNFAYESVYIMINNKQGGFTFTSFKDADGPNSVTLADLNGDGNLDAVVANTLATATVLLGNGDGTFKVTQDNIAYPSGDQLPTAIGDVNGDGIPDLILAADGSIGVALGIGDGTFAASPVVWGSGPAVGQFFFENLHGQSPSASLPDIVSPDGSGGVMVLLNLTK